MAKIIRKQELNPTVTLLEVEAPLIARRVRAGQFIILRIDEYGERIPLTVADWDIEASTVTVIFQHVGLTTKLLAALAPGDTIRDFVGPLGMPTELPEWAERICVVGGGVGCAIAYPQAKALHRDGLRVDVIAGFRNRDLVILEDEFRAVSHELLITTDDGSYVRQGFVTDVLRERMEGGAGYDLVVAIGPIPMMQAICGVTAEYKIPTIVSLNPLMVDGTGMCGCCRVTVGGKVRFACIEGPDFDGHLVDFSSLMVRNRAYQTQEHADAERHDCRLEQLGKRVIPGGEAE